jgi:hypothetical protein
MRTKKIREKKREAMTIAIVEGDVVLDGRGESGDVIVAGLGNFDRSQSPACVHRLAIE